MATKKKLLQAAAGAAGGAALNVEDVFSTYLYDGTDATQTIQNGINLGSSYGGQSYSFDGSDDFLLRTSDFTSNTDSKTFTFSCWYFSNLDQTGYWYTTSNGASNNGRVIIGRANGNLQIIAYNNSGSSILNVSTSANIPYGTWNHIVVSIDLANTSNRHVYINDSAHTVSYNIYTNDTIGFSNTTHAVSGNSYNSSSSGQTSLAHVFLDYTYRDLSVESNRRLFYSSSGEPATGQASLNPIMYMTLTSESSPNTNSGTGGDFTTQGSPTYNSNFGPDAGGTGEGGLVWLKNRGFTVNGTTGITDSHQLIDTERGASYRLISNTTGGNNSATNYFSSFNSNGFTVGTTMSNGFDGGHRYASWTFRKAPKFFDVVTYTGNGANRAISHNLGSVPGFIIVKSTSAADLWECYHRSLGPTQYIRLDSTNAAAAASSTHWQSTNPTSTEFYVGTTGALNTNGVTYVAYLFAHNNGDGEFGPDADQDIIKCGSYTGTSSINEIDLGFEAQWVLIKNTTNAQNWMLYDAMRGMVSLVGTASDAQLSPNLSTDEVLTDTIAASANGFTLENSSLNTNRSANNYIYIAIRRGPMAVPTDATEVFAVDRGDTTSTDPQFISNFPVDMAIYRYAAGAAEHNIGSRITGATYGQTQNTNVYSGDNDFTWDYMNGWYASTRSTDYYSWMWKRAPNFCDVVAYTGNGTAGHTVSHNLGVAPEMMWVKARDLTAGWNCYLAPLGATKYLELDNSNIAGTATDRWNDTEPTDTVFTLGTRSGLNQNNNTYIAYLFASLDGVSKVGSYTGNGTSQTIDCGFSSGARFVLVKCVDATYDWQLFDTERGIVVGNDSKLALNTTQAEQTNGDFIEPSSSGFAVTSSNSMNANGLTFIFYAIA